MSGNVAAVDCDIAAPALTAAADTSAAVGIHRTAGRVNLTAVDIDMTAVTLKAAADTRRVFAAVVAGICDNCSAVNIDSTADFTFVAADGCRVIGVYPAHQPAVLAAGCVIDVERRSLRNVNAILRQ